MTIIRLGKTREATAFTSEKYKSAIRQYMQSVGYAQLTDSALEGHLADMIFRPLGNAPWPEVWAEAKATELSLSSEGLANEVRSYLKEWLPRIPESRFKFMIFAKKLVNLSRWEEVWGNNILEAKARDWLTSDCDENTASYFNDPSRSTDIASFFSETYVIVGTDADLIDQANEKRRVSLSANEVRQRALHQLELMAQRARPIAKKSDLVANLIRFKPPTSLAVFEIDPLSNLEVQNMMRQRDSPPYLLPEKGKLLTVDYRGAEDRFRVLNPSPMETLSVESLEQTYSGSLARLVNFAVGKILRQLGVGFSNGRTYFLASRQAAMGKPRVLELDGGETIQVARPYYDKGKKTEGFLQVETPQPLNFVFHQGFSMRYRSLWSQHLIEVKMGKLYTRDGIVPIEGSRAARLDAKFRNPIWDRSETRQNRLEKLVDYVFHSRTRRYPDWMREFSFGDFLRIPTDWTPDAVPIEQTVMDDFEIDNESREDE